MNYKCSPYEIHVHIHIFRVIITIATMILQPHLYSILTISLVTNIFAFDFLFRLSFDPNNMSHASVSVNSDATFTNSHYVDLSTLQKLTSSISWIQLSSAKFLARHVYCIRLPILMDSDHHEINIFIYILSKRKTE